MEKSAADTENDILLEKKQRLELEYKRLESELHLILDKNENLRIESKHKEEILKAKDAEKKALEHRNKLEMEQFELELAAMVDDLEHDLDVVSGGVIHAELEKERFLVLQKENDDIKEAINKVQEDIFADNRTHVEDMHRMNRALQHDRMKMEEEFRKQLLNMDLSFQNEAFLKLDDNRKQAMLANSKLKDELGLLSVGLSALGVRYERDTRMVIDARVHLDDLERKGRLLKKAVGALAKIKVRRRDLIKKVNDDISEFKKKQKEIDDVLFQPPSIGQLELDLRNVENQLINERILIDMWRERERLMKLLKKEYKLYANEDTHKKNLLYETASMIQDKKDDMSINSSSSGGRLSVRAPLFGKDAINPMPVEQDLSDRSLQSIATLDSSVRQRVRGTSGINLRADTKGEKELRKGLKRLKGRESMLIDGSKVDPTVNVTGWIAAQVINIWKITKEQCKLQEENMESHASIGRASRVPSVDDREHQHTAVPSVVDYYRNEAEEADILPPAFAPSFSKEFLESRDAFEEEEEDYDFNEVAEQEDDDVSCELEAAIDDMYGRFLHGDFNSAEELPVLPDSATIFELIKQNNGDTEVVSEEASLKMKKERELVFEGVSFPVSFEKLPIGAIAEQPEDEDSPEYFFNELRKSFSDAIGHTTLDFLYNEELRRSFSAADAIKNARHENEEDEEFFSHYQGFPSDFTNEKRDKHISTLKKIKHNLHRDDAAFNRRFDPTEYLKEIGPPTAVKTLNSGKLLALSASEPRLSANTIDDTKSMSSHGTSSQRSDADLKSLVNTMKITKSSTDPLAKKSLKYSVRLKAL